MEGKITYFDKIGPDNTEATLAIAKKRADELGIKTILIASTRGEAAIRAADVFKGCKVVAVGHVFGMREPNKNEFTDENRKKFESKGGIAIFSNHTFTGITRRPTPPPAPGTPPTPMTGPVLEIGDVIANTLRMVCAGIKVVIECGCMAADAGAIRTDEDIIAIAGSGRGADTAVVMRAATSSNLFRSRVNEILCKPLVYAAGGPPPAAGAPGAGAPGGAARPA